MNLEHRLNTKYKQVGYKTFKDIYDLPISKEDKYDRIREAYADYGISRRTAQTWVAIIDKAQKVKQPSGNK